MSSSKIFFAAALLTIAGWTSEPAQAFFSQARTCNSATEINSVAMGDFNGDGDTDFAVGDRDHSYVAILNGDGRGNCTGLAHIALSSPPGSVAAGDFNGDGDPDLAMGCSGSCRVSILLGGGGHTFFGPINFGNGSGCSLPCIPESIAAGDFNGDGDPDLAVANTTSDSVSVLLGGSGGGFSVETNFTVQDEPVGVTIGEFSGDGDPDLAVLNRGSDSVSVLLGGPGGIFSGATNFASGGGCSAATCGPSSIAVGEFNGDGDPDLAVANDNVDNVSILLGGTGGSFSAPADFAVGNGLLGLVAGDLNGDGDDDLAVGSGRSDQVSVLLGESGATFSAPANYALRDARPLAIGNFNGDGNPDLAVARNGRVTIMLGKGGGEFPGAINFQVAPSPRRVAVADFNGDGDPDLAIAHASGSRVSISLGGTGGSFTSPTELAAVGNPHEVAVGDFNGDGDPDLATPNDQDDSVSIYLGGPGGSFSGPVAFAVGDRPTAIGVGDFNLDGDPDLAVANQGSGPSSSVSILLGGPGGTFLASSPITTGTGPYVVAVADFNGDADPDLAVGNFNSEDVSILLGGPGAGFSAPTNLCCVERPESIAVGDFNSDADPDLALTGGGDYSVLLGTSGGGFSGPTHFGVNVAYGSVAVGDFNGDAKPDLASSDPCCHEVNVAVGVGDGSFYLPPFTFDVSDGPEGVAVGDFDSDGYPDLAIANSYSNNVSILLADRPEVGVGDVLLDEGNAGTTTFTFTVTRTGNTIGPSSVHFATQDGSATAEQNDYESVSGDLQFATNQTSKTIGVTVNGDAVPESHEEFRLQLSGVVNGVIADGEGTGTILNDELVGYARPKGAQPTQVTLVPAYAPCTSPNAEHGPPLAVGSCRPVQPASSYLTVGTFDSNGAAPNSSGYVHFRYVCNPPAPHPTGLCTNAGEQADVELTASLTDVRNKPSLSDYAGELRVQTALRLTDRSNGPGAVHPATASDTPFGFTMTCLPTDSASIGSTCSAATHADAVMPGIVLEDKRAVWQLGKVEVYDGGADGDADTTGDNTLFATQGLFAP